MLLCISSTPCSRSGHMEHIHNEQSPCSWRKQWTESSHYVVLFVLSLVSGSLGPSTAKTGFWGHSHRPTIHHLLFLFLTPFHCSQQNRGDLAQLKLVFLFWSAESICSSDTKLPNMPRIQIFTTNGLSWNLTTEHILLWLTNGTFTILPRSCTYICIVLLSSAGCRSTRMSVTVTKCQPPWKRLSHTYICVELIRSSPYNFCNFAICLCAGNAKLLTKSETFSQPSLSWPM